MMSKSDLCRGYDLGVTCVGCCHLHTQCYEIWDYVELPIRVRLRERSIASPDPANNDLSVSLIDGVTPPFCSLDILTEAVEYVGGNFDQASDRFGLVVEFNTEYFQDKISKGWSIEKISETKRFVGRVNGNVGCLLYPHEDAAKGIFYRQEGCVSYLCDVALGLDMNRLGKNVMKSFIRDNIENPKFNTLSYSRMIHLMGCHPNVVKLLGFDIRPNFMKFDFSLKDLNGLLEIVTK